MNGRLLTSALVALATIGLLAEYRHGPPIFVSLGAGAAVILGLLLIYRIFEFFEWAAFVPRPEEPGDDEGDEDTIDDWEIDHDDERDWN